MKYYKSLNNGKNRYEGERNNISDYNYASTQWRTQNLIFGGAELKR